MIAPAARYHDRLKKMRQAIHVKRRQLVLDDETYRAILMRVAGVTSSADLMSQDAAHAVLGELDRLLGAGRARRVQEWRFVFRLPPEKQLLCKKIYRCAEKIGLAQTPPLPVMPKAWVEGIARQSRGAGPNVVTPLEMQSPEELRLIIQILESWARKIGA